MIPSDLCIRICEEPGGAGLLAEWAAFDEDGALAARSERPGPVEQELLQAARAAKDARVLVLIPTERALLTHVEIPARHPREASRLLAYAIEEKLATDVEDMLLALGPEVARGEVSTYAVAAVERAWMDRWLEALRQANLDPAVMIPDALALPFQPGAWTAARLGHRLALRHGPCAGAAVDYPLAGLYLSALLAETEAPSGVCCYDVDPMHVALLSEKAGAPVTRAPVEESVFITLCREWLRREETPPINLLQQSYASAEAKASRRNPFASLARIAAMGCVLQLLATLGAALYFDVAAGRMKEEVVAAHREFFPKETRIVNARAQMEARLRPAGKSEFFSLFGALAHAYAPLRDRQKIALEALSYDALENRLEVDARADSLEAIEAYRKSIAGMGLRVTLGDAASEGGGVRGNLRVGL